MATKPLKTLTFEGLDDIYTVPQIDASLSTTGKAADAKATGDSLAEKASASGMVDMAKSLVGGKYTSEKQPYHFRKSPSGGAKDEVIVGGSLAWNQLFQTNNYRQSTVYGITFAISNGKLHVSGTTSADGYTHYVNNLKGISGHKYLFTGIGKDANVNDFRVDLSPSTYTTSGYCICGCTENTSNGAIYIYFSNNKTIDFYADVNIIDLTVCFGTTIADYIYSLETANAGAGVAWVKRYINLDTYHEYDAGSIQSVEGLVSHDVVGFNQWDEEWEIGSYNPTTGEKDANHASWRNKNPIPIIPNTQYYFYTNSAQSAGARAFWYDADGNYMSLSYGFNALVTPPSNARFLNIRIEETHTSDTKLCINLSDPSRNGTYEPYEKHSYPLDSDVVLRGVPKLVTDHIEFDGDKYRADGTLERRYAEYTFTGSETWIFYETSNLKTFNTVITGAKAGGVGIMTDYSWSSVTWISGQTEKSFMFFAQGNAVRISFADSEFSDVSSFASHMAGKKLIFESTTPTTETAQPFQSPMIVGATEEYISDSVVPVGHESKYYEDVAKKVSGLPKDFSTLIAPVEVTFTATRNYTVGSYLIVNNTLYKVTANIANGGTITPNTNVTATTIMAEFMSL